MIVTKNFWVGLRLGWWVGSVYYPSLFLDIKQDGPYSQTKAMFVLIVEDASQAVNSCEACLVLGLLVLRNSCVGPLPRSTKRPSAPVYPYETYLIHREPVIGLGQTHRPDLVHSPDLGLRIRHIKWTAQTQKSLSITYPTRPTWSTDYIWAVADPCVMNFGAVASVRPVSASKTHIKILDLLPKSTHKSWVLLHNPYENFGFCPQYLTTHLGPSTSNENLGRNTGNCS